MTPPAASPHAGETGPTSTWSLLRSPVFRAVWLGALFSNIGGLLHDTASAWTMASLSAHPLWVTLLSTALSLPLFFLGLPAGALGDLVSPRRVLLRSESFLAVVALGLAGLAATGRLDAPWLLGFTLLIGVGTAFSLPAWQSLLPELVAKNEIPAAVALNGLSFNLARAVGPASAGLILSFSGPAVCFALNGLSYAVIVWVLWRGKRSAPVRPPSGEALLDAIVAGVRYVRHAPLLRTVMLRMIAFVFPATGVVALFPLLARREWGFGPAAFGVFMAAYGLGAVVAATFLPRLRRRFSLRALVAFGSGAFVLFGLTLALAPGGYALVAIMPVGGAGWMTVLSTLNASAQAASAPWVRGRALAFNLLCSQGGIAFGALLAGLLASRIGLTPTLLLSAGLLLLGAFTLHSRDLEGVKRLDLDPALTWSEPVAVIESPGAASRPATITVDYLVAPHDRSAFISALRDLSVARRRTGALHWELIERVEGTGEFQERFTVSTWDEHLRQHRRFTRSDAALEARVDAFHRGPNPPEVKHWLHP